jgi:hypothetical protein
MNETIETQETGNELTNAISQAAAQGAEWGVSLTIYGLALLLFVTFMTYLWNWFRAN